MKATSPTAHRVLLLTALACLVLPIPAAAAVDICRDPQADSLLSVSRHAFDAGSLGGNATLDPARTDADFLLRASGRRYFFGLGHRYSILDIDPDIAQTNGHLHTFFVPLHRQVQNGRHEFRVTLAPALSASSNVMQHLDDYFDDAFQLLAAIAGRTELAKNLSLRYGLCGDHRFGRYRVYPVLGVRLQPDADWEVELGYPASAVRYRVSPSLDTSLRYEPDGSEWYVRNRALGRASTLAYESWALRWALDWHFADAFTLSIEAGRQFGNELHLTTDGGRSIRYAGASTNRAGVGVAWRF